MRQTQRYGAPLASRIGGLRGVIGQPINLLSEHDAKSFASTAMPTIDLTDDEHAAVTAAIGRLIEEDKFPHAPRLNPLGSGLAKLEAPTTSRPVQGGKRTRR